MYGGGVGDGRGSMYGTYYDTYYLLPVSDTSMHTDILIHLE